jgi:hypothetical protein
MRRKLEMALDPHEWHNLSKLALSYGIGLPAKLAPPPPPQRDGLYFVHYKTQRALECGSDDVMEAKTTRMLESKAQEERLLAIEAGTADPEVILAARAAADRTGKVVEVVDGAEEQLEAVDMPVADISAIRDMLGPPSSQYERDRPARGER